MVVMRWNVVGTSGISYYPDSFYSEFLARMKFLTTIERWQSQYLLAIALPALVTVVMWFLHGYISAANITLLYIVAVIVTAVNTATRPALAAALVSFFAFNLSFTEPKGSLFVIQKQDMLTAGLFLLTAITVGQLAARVKEQLELLQHRERFNRIELEFLEQLAAAIEPEKITEALLHAIGQLPGLEYTMVSVENGIPDWESVPQPVPAALRKALQAPLQIASGNPDSLSWQADSTLFMILNDGSKILSGLLVSNSSATTIDWVKLLASQSNLALARTRLVGDLEAERIDKENELIRSSLLSSVSHDFRTPLTSMVGAASTLLDLNDQLKEAQKKELLEAILSEARRLNSYTQKLLDMTRLGRGELKLNRSTITIDEVLNVVLKRIRQQFPNHRIKTEIKPDLSALHVHAALIEQALYNVLENACKFTPDSKPIRISCREDAHDMIIEVEDAGPGVPDSEKSKVFEMFHSADRGDCRAAGSGLGLAISKGMIGAHGGNVAIDDSLDLGGSLVRIRLPRPIENVEQNVL
jgi:two-component system sensor histidine kinase KdpD